MKNKVPIQVFGAEYNITTEESDQYVQKLGVEIDEALRKIIGTSSASLPDALVLLCLTYLDSYKKAEDGSDNLREQVAEYLQEATDAKLELVKAQAEIERLGRDHQLSMEEE